jgi:putative transposase
MAMDNSALLQVLETLTAADVSDRVRIAAQTIYQALIDAELTSVIGAGPWERSETRTNQRNGTRARTLSTPAGDLELRIPKLRSGSFFPSLLERRRRVDQALFAVVMEAYVHGVSTRKVDDLVAALGVTTGVSRSEVSRICEGLDAEFEAFRTRPLSGSAFSLDRLATAVLVEQHDEWQVSDRRYLSETSMALLTTPAEPVVAGELLAAS